MVGTNMTKNVSENVTTDILANLYDVPVYMAICAVITVAVEVIGNGLLASVIMYEKFGMDPQKRTTINQLVSKVCWMLIMTNLAIFPFMVVRTLFGPQSELLGSWILHGIMFSMMYNFLTLTETMILKCLYIFYWPRMAMLDDTLLSQFMVQWNLMIASLCIFTRLHIGEYHTNTQFQFITGMESFNIESALSIRTRIM
jgi:hypothetical protein